MYIDEQQDREASKTSPEMPVAELELNPRAESALAKAGIEAVGQALERMAKGDQAMLDIDGFGRKSLADLKRALKRRGFELPEAALEPQV
ncbi:MAG: DNA-directed RNA polymerase subunit alpha C-terminal domain-containing protein [Anaerolineales bacterium]